MLTCHQCGTSLSAADRFCASCGTAARESVANEDPLVGRTIGGSYIILELVGVGGMGRVYRAEQRMLGRTVAIKVIHPHLLEDEQSVARFYTEARAASRLNHPNSVSIIDFGRTDDGILYLAMEFLEGKDLSRLMREDGPLPLARVSSVTTGILAALGEAHALDVIHRDLKPENVIVERLRSGEDLVKVVDFGLAKLLSGAQTSTSITLPGLVCGTPDYMSPEQGRGEEVGPTGDLYSVGVLLFELLTEQLPFTADTPTNVVLRHIQDPVPDPRDVAPHRNIPEALVQVVLKALSKAASDRYADAGEMARALKQVDGEVRGSTDEIICTSCGRRSPSAKRFCGECGAPIAAVSAPQRMSLPPRVAVHTGHTGTFVGRTEELTQLDQLRVAAQGRLVWGCLVGEPGVGKTRMLSELAERASGAGDLVVGSGPHPSGAPVPYSPIRTIVMSLFDVDADGLAALAKQTAETNPLAAAGIRELIDPVGLVGAAGGRTAAVAHALVEAVKHGVRTTGASRAVIMVDDLHRCDGLTPRALQELAATATHESILLLTSANTPKPSLLAEMTHVVSLRGLSADEASVFLSTGGAVLPSGDSEERLFLPLYLEQLRSLGLSLDRGPHPLPQRLSDAVDQSVRRLNVSAQRVLQAVSVLGNRCAYSTLTRVARFDDIDGLQLLVERGLVVEDHDQVEVVHPFIRDLVEASIPAEARKELHARALDAIADDRTPLEVRARHAAGAGETTSALMLLERLGDLATQRGDPDTAVQGYQRGLEMARRELLETGDTGLEGAIASVSRRLGTALASRGELTGAEGVLREALEFSGPQSVQRARTLIRLGRVVAQRERTRDAYRLLGQALDIATQLEALPEQAAAHRAIGAVRLAEGNVSGAVEAHRLADGLVTDSDAPALEKALSAVDLAEAMLAAETTDGLIETLERAEELATTLDAPRLSARVMLMRASFDARQGDEESATARREEAAYLAAIAGDARLMELAQSVAETEPFEQRVGA